MCIELEYICFLKFFHLKELYEIGPIIIPLLQKKTRHGELSELFQRDSQNLNPDLRNALISHKSYQILAPSNKEGR